MKMYLDIENIQPSVPDNLLVFRVNQALQTYDRKYFLLKLLCGNKI